MLVRNVKMADDCCSNRFEDVLSSSESNSQCALCVKEVAKYTCPRCHVRYCSSACYKSDKHLQCSELFYKDCVMEAMFEQQGSRENKLKMFEMLKKLEKEDENDNTLDTEDLEERLHDIDVNSDPEAVWSALTDRERQEFESAVKSGKISDVIEVWTPWWSIGNDRKNRKKIEDISEENSTEKTNVPKGVQLQTVGEGKVQNMPPIKKNITPLHSVIKNSNVNPNVQFSCIDVLFAYTYIMRLYNGCPEDSLDQAAENLLQISPVLSKNAVFESVESVIHNCLSAVQHSKDLYCSEEISHQAVLDVMSLIRGCVVRDGKKANFVESALSHMCRLLRGGRERLKVNSKVNQQEADLCKSMWLAKKKVEFLLAWVHKYPDILESFSLNIQVVHMQVSTSHEQHKEQTEKLEQAWGGSKPPKKASIITEI